MTTERLPGMPTCPACGHLLDGAIAVHLVDAMPQPGDVTVCSHCAAWLVFMPATGSVGLALRYPTDDELRVMLADDRMALATEVVLQMIRRS